MLWSFLFQWGRSGGLNLWVSGVGPCGAHLAASAGVSAGAASHRSVPRSLVVPGQKGGCWVPVQGGARHLFHQGECHGGIALVGGSIGIGSLHVVLCCTHGHC